MKLCTTLILSFLIASTSFGQTDPTPKASKKNAIGLSISPLDIGLSPFDKDVPTVRLEYRRALKDKLELRFSLGYQHDSNNLSNSGYSVALGLNKYIYQTDKIGIYAAAEAYYDRANLFVINPVEPRSIDIFKNSNVGIGTLLGLEYRVTSRLDFFLETNLLDFTVFEKFGEFKSASLDNFRFLRGAEVGVKYRF